MKREKMVPSEELRPGDMFKSLAFEHPLMVLSIEFPTAEQQYMKYLTYVTMTAIFVGSTTTKKNIIRHKSWNRRHVVTLIQRYGTDNDK